ncbi:MAG TPA: hypothetical protein DCE03_05530 [Synergistaceae bacterium]|nr:hypothetical protein [Synergistaceae bacterium]
MVLVVQREGGFKRFFLRAFWPFWRGAFIIYTGFPLAPSVKLRRCLLVVIAGNLLHSFWHLR